MRRLIELICPARMGPGFRRLVASSWLSNLGDGIGLAAGPLLVASQTDRPVLVAMATLLQRLPWLLFGLSAGAIADRVDRRWLVVAADGGRAVVLAVLTVTIVTDQVSVATVLAALFLLGTAEVFADVASSTLLPMLVQPADLGIGNARLIAGFVTANQLIGPPIGAFLFGLGLAIPFASEVIFFALGAMVLTKLVVDRPARSIEQVSVRSEIADGMRWLWRHAAMRTLTITILAFNITFGAAWSVLVLYSRQRLGLGGVGFGLISTFMAFGGVVGSVGYGWLERHVSLGNIMRAGLIIETLTHLGLALATVPWVAMSVFFVFGIHASAWGATSSSVRQRAVPAEFQGRVGSVYLMGMQGSLVVGALIGGLIADRWGVVAPFWFAFVGSAVILVWIWRSLAQIAHADAALASAT